MSTKRLLIPVIMFITAMAMVVGVEVYALQAPHDSTKGVSSCNQCHRKSGYRTLTSFNSHCFNTNIGCHNSAGGPNVLTSKKKLLTMLDASNRFGKIAQSNALPNTIMPRTVALQNSHGWKIPYRNVSAGVFGDKTSLLGESGAIPGSTTKWIYCTRCHRVMAGTGNAKFLRRPLTGNLICLKCHSARRISNVSEPRQAGLDYSHPVEVNYSTARAAKPDFFNESFRLATGYDESARVRLYTTHESAQADGRSRLAGKNKGAVVCQSCHGPIHSADSNPYTLDNLTSWSKGNTNYSSSAGNLLRTYPIAGPKASNKLCLSCHNVTTHKTFLCGRCHTPHKKPGEDNRYLILENISTPSNGKRSVVFTSRSGMAARYQAGYSTTASRLLRPVSNRICQVCHTGTKFHRNYSSPSGADGTGIRTHNMRDPAQLDSTQGYLFCPQCHKHNNPAGGFIPSGCATCHSFPPNDTIVATDSFRHAKHTNSGVEPGQSANTFWKTGKVTDNRSDTSYGFSCGRCHSPWAPYTAPGGDGYIGKNHYGSSVSQSLYTADVGFKIKTSINPLPWNPSGSYLYSNAGAVKDGTSTKWWGAGTGATCRDLYCHGQWYNGYTSNNPNARGTQPCGSCHGASNTDPPGKTGGAGNNYGAHPRHVGSANNQQYGSGTPNFRCNACHSLTSKYNNETTVSSRKYHVNGKVNIKFDNGSSSNFRVGNGSSNYGGYPGGYNGYTSRRPASFIRPAYTTCSLIYCHSRGNRIQGSYSAPNNAGIGAGGNGRFPNWSSSRNFTTTMNIGGYTMKTRCARCHGNTTYKGITMAMPNYTGIAYGGPKENSHRKHVIENKFRCNVCHSSTINSANNSIASTQNHVNKFYNISIISTYRDGGVGNNYDSAAKRCSSITCHAGKTTPTWGSKIGCPDCHLSNTGDVDKRIKVSNIFQSFSETAPRIYSTQWADTGHGRSNATQYPSGTNYGANKVCTNCHMASVAHGTSNNPFRLYTAPDRPNRVCEGCHGTSPWVGGASRTGIQTHASSVVQTGKHNFAIKCIDCHDPHGDNNSRFMVHSTVARPLITGTRAESSNQYGQRLTNVTSSNVDFVNNQYTSDYARKYKAAKICQVCHTRTKDQTASDPKPSRFRWYSASDKAHGVAKCTSCHSHGSGFKGAGCNGCHGFPPTDIFNVLSGGGRTLANPDNRQRPSSNPSTPTTEAATAGAHRKHFGNFSGAYSQSKQTICSFCHQGGMYGNGQRDYDIEIGFKPFPDYTGSGQIYGGQQAVKDGYYGYSGIGMSYDGTMRCTVKCHGGGNWLSNNLGNYSAPRWNVSSSVRCGKCHGAKRASGVGSWPTSNRHARHAGTSGTGYDFMCRLCHADTVMGTATTLNKTNHVNGQATFRFYTGADTGDRVWSGSAYNGGDTKVNTGFGRCEDLYCHSRGTTTSPSYAAVGAYPNYTARWNLDISTWNAGERCSLCHGSKKNAGGYAGITSAMPNQANQAHKKHVVDNGFKCYFCHSATVDSSNAIVSTTNHVNKFKNISIVSSYRTGQTMYSSSLSSTNKTCKNVRCHAGRKTPNWTVSYGTISCPDCHYSNTADTDSFIFNNFSGTAAQIYSTEWTKRGHGKSKASGKYPFSNNTGAQKNCTNCHKPAVQHGASNNYFRLYSSNSDNLCLSCHGRGAQLNAWGQGYSDITGIQSHTWANISTAGYVSAANGGNKRKAAIDGGWNFGQHDGGDQKKVKCVDCHDPHGDKNNYMVHSYINMSGSDRMGRPNPSAATAQMTFSTVGGPQMNWSSYVKPLSPELGLCQRCHTPMTNTTAMTNFNKGKYSDHNRTNRCTKCHKHKQGFKPSGCDGCHGYPPPAGPTSPNPWAEILGDSNTWGLHTPHAKNPRSRPGIIAENDVTGAAGFKCNRCHANTSDGSDTTMGASTNYNAVMTQLKSTYGNWTANSQSGYQSVTDDTCSRITCHTPRYYTRQWTKPTDCDDCHGYRNKTETAAGAFKIQTTGSHKIHVNYSTPGIAGTDFKKYGLRCSNCHYDWQTINNYSTHYSSYVNITANGPVNVIAKMKIKDGQFYTKGRLFKGFTTGNESFGTCARAYCHGNFTNGTTATLPNWKRGVSPVTCTSCHKGKLTGGDGSGMPERHPKHVSTYSFPCVRCHVRTAGNITTVIFNYSSHVNGRKDVYFDSVLPNSQATFDSNNRFCSNLYCHSKGFRSSGAGFTTRTTLANYTANWNIQDVETEKTGVGKKCSFCHGNKIYNGITAAMPNQTSLWGNSHRTHVIRNNFRCVVCHSATVNAAGTINYAGGDHVNGFKNITIIATYKQGQTMYSSQVPATNKTCKNVRCHAGKTTPKWGTYATCKSCHLSTVGDANKRISGNNSFQGFSETAPRIYSADWGQRGHGSKGKNCYSCHKPSVSHGTASNPFRIFTTHNGNPNALCEDCHGSSVSNPEAGTKKDIQTHASSVTQTGRHHFEIKCVDCHDPHGDNNQFMIHSTIGTPNRNQAYRKSSDTYGMLLANVTGRPVAFTQNLYSSDYAKKTQANKICQVCHSRTYDPISSSPSNPYYKKSRFRYYSASDKAHGVGKCTNCHSHSRGFKGAKCDSCHGYPPTLIGFNTLSGTNTDPKQRASGTITAGVHGRHSSILLQGQAGGDRSALCNFCHNGGMSTTGTNDGKITIRFGAGTFAQYTVGLYKGQDTVKNGYYNYSGYPGMKSTTNNTKRCENVKCHGAQGNWLTKSFGKPTAPVWNDTTRSTVFCGSCHGAKKSNTVASTNTWPTTKAHELHAGTDATKQQNLMCRVCHGITVLGTATTLSKSNHVNAAVYVKFTTEGRVDGNSTYLSGGTEVNATYGKCWNTYCHSKGTKKFAPYTAAASLMNFTATWNDAGQRGSYTKGYGQKAKCNYCHGNKSWSGVTSAMPNYNDGTPKANKHPKHVKEYSFLCNSCHNNVVANNTSIQGGNYSLHVNRSYNVNFSNAPGGRTIENAQGSYTSTGSKCESTYCHSRGVDLVSSFSRITTLANYTAKWGDTRGGINTGNGSKPTMTRCNYCHGNGAAGGFAAAAPNYVNTTPKANRHPMHVTTYGFTCTVCHNKVTANGTSIDAAGGRDRHVNKAYNINFSNAAPFAGNTGIYTYLTAGLGSKCKNTYCHSRGTDFVPPYNTRTSLSNFTAAWGDNRSGYSQANGVKAKCNYCHGNRLFSGITAAMPNYSSSTAKNNTHPLHVGTYGFTCTVCHVKVAANSTSISDSSLHVNHTYNINFNKSVPGRSFLNNTGNYTYISLSAKSRCRNTYCHSRGTDRVAPYITRTSLANFTAMWGDSRSGYSQAKGVKAKCNYCHGNKAFSGITAAMPNYSTESGKPNTHRKHVISLGYPCFRCHYGVSRNNTSISDRANHVNGFYNISIAPGFSGSAGLKRYSGVYNNSGGTCMNNTCHGSSKPKWGQTNLPCQGCHLSNTGDLDQNGQFNGTAPRIYSTAWADQGHGRQTAYPSGNPAANKGCQAPNGCHKASVSHKTASNPFRLFTLAKSDGNPNTLCLDCHKTGPTNPNPATQAVGIMTHASSVTQTGRYNFAMKCVDCHDPHGDNNRYMLHSTLARPRTTTGRLRESSNQYGQLLTNITGRNVDFLQTLYTSDYARKFKADKPCQVCHTQTKNPSTLDSRFRYYSAKDKPHGTGKCTASCHKHTAGFKGAGESAGNESCDGCHGSGDLFEKMRSTSGYHHVMSNTSADNTNNSKYPNVTAFGPNDQKSSRRRCLMCHVDHNVFRPDLNNDGTGGRARNLRWSVLAQGNKTGINTDFWPAKRKNATGRLGADATSGNYSSTYPIYGPAQYNGICISCHKNVQYKSTSLANAFNVQKARPFQVGLYTSSSHNFQVISSSFVFGSGGNRSRFRGNCTKCHRTSDAYSDLSKSSAQQGYGKWPVALHDKNVPSLMMDIATSSLKPKIEQLCYNCHDTLARTGGGPGSMDYYSSIKMNSGAKMIKTAITGKRYVKPIEDDGMAGMHKIDEYYKAVTSVSENSNPTLLWNYSTGAPGGVGRHIECVDCHNTHGGNASIRRLAGAPFRGKLNTQQASYQNYTRSTGNMIAGAQKGVWGVSLSYSNGVSYRGQTPQFKKVAQVSYQYEVCLKCHSRYAYGTNPPGVPDGLPDPAGTTVVAYDNLAPDVPQADISRMINPNNYGYHPIFRKGRNQPPKGANTNWPSAGKSNWMYKDRFNNKTAFISVSGLSWNFVPPFSQHSLLACTDCHVADNSGKALGKYRPGAAPNTTGTWSNATKANIEKSGDGFFARGSTAGASIEVDVTCPTTPGPAPDANGLNVVLYARTNNTGANNQRTMTLDALKSSVIQGVTGTVVISKGTTTVFGRYERNVGTWTEAGSWPTIESSYTVKLTTSSTAQNLDVDYIGIEVVYTTTADVRGPHGSMQRWILTDVDRDIWFDADNSNTLTYNNTDRPNASVPASGADGNIFEGSTVFCWNCHRRDVYYANAPANKLYARFSHDGADMDQPPFSTPNQWGIACMNCHAGNGIGEIHGSFANSTTNWPTQAQHANLTRPRGVRLLNGAMMNFNPTNSGCYTIDATGTPYGAGCSGAHTGDKTMVPNYTYTSW